MKYARRSVSDADIRRYEMFSQVSFYRAGVVYCKLLALTGWKISQNLQQTRSFGNNFKFPEGGEATGTGQTAVASNAGFGADDAADDDLYA